MSAQALQQLKPAPQGLVQRRGAAGPGGSAFAPAIRDGGRSLDAAVRAPMEAGFGQDFSRIRVHDDGQAHDSARALGARAYAAGDHIVFGEGAYRPETPSGKALLAHELAHSVQQGGVQMKAAGPLPASSDAELEAQADRAAFDVTSGRQAAALSRVNRPAIMRQPAGAAPPAGGSGQAPQPGPAQNLPPGMSVIKDDPPGLGSTELVLEIDQFTLPAEKGTGDWVQKAYTEAANGKRLVFSPLIEGTSVATYKEGHEDYKSIWLGKFGFSTTTELAAAFKSAATSAPVNPEVATALKDPGVAKLIDGMHSSLAKSGCDIDHIVEKQMGGTSIPSNLQLLDNDKNRKSGREAYQALLVLVKAIRDPTMRGPAVRNLQLRLKSVTVPPATNDASFIVEGLLRKGAVKGSDTVKAKAEGSPVALTAGGVGETVHVRDTGATPIDSMAKRIVPGMRLTTYERAGKGKADTVKGELDSRAAKATGAGKGGAADSTITLKAELDTAAAPTGPAADGQAAEANKSASERRILKLYKPANSKIGFYYPYLSPGMLTSLSMSEAGELRGEGVIHPSVPILGDLHVRYGHDLLEIVAPIPAEKLKPPIPGFRFTEGNLALTLSPTFVPSGKLKFEIGPAPKPVILGELEAKYADGAFVATGLLLPGAKLPGISAAEGKVEYHSEKGWSGKLSAKSTSIPKSTVSAELGFTSGKSGFQPYGHGGISTHIKDSTLDLGVHWSGGPVSYTGGVTLLKPLPLVETVRLEGGYANELLSLTGQAAIKWKSIDSTMTVSYRRKDGEEGKLSGKAGIDIKTEKASGHLAMAYAEDGGVSGEGAVSYQVTKDIRPTLRLSLTKDHRVKVGGEAALADIPLSKKWPAPDGGKLTFIKGIGAKFSVPTPVPGVTAFGEVRVSAGLGYGVGPVGLHGVKFEGELYPLETDPQIKARLKGSLVVPAYAELYGAFGAYVGAEVLLGAAGAKGGVEVIPSLRVDGKGGLDFDAAYEADAFSFSAEAYATGKMSAQLKVDLTASVYAGWGLVEHTWTYHAANLSKDLGGELKLTLGKIAYGKDGHVTWPDISQIKLEPENLDPIELIKGLMERGKTTETAQAQPNTVGNKI